MNQQKDQQPEQQNRMNPNQQKISGQQTQQPEPQAMGKKTNQADVKQGEHDENFEKQAQTEKPESNPKEFVRKDGKNQDQQPERSDRLN